VIHTRSMETQSAHRSLCGCRMSIHQNCVSFGRLGTARSVLPESADWKSPVRWSSGLDIMSTDSAQGFFLCAELQSELIVASCRAAQLIHSVSRKRERQAGVAVHGRGCLGCPLDSNSPCGMERPAVGGCAEGEQNLRCPFRKHSVP